MTGDAVPGDAVPAVGPAPRPARIGRRAMLLGLGAAAVLLLAVAGALVAFRYVPALGEARALRTDLEAMVDRVRETGLEVDRATMDALDADQASARRRLDGLDSLLAGDPLVRLARAFPLTSANVRGADGVVAAAGELLDAVGEGLAIGRQYVDIREAQAADPGTASAFSQLVELMATSRDRAVSAAASVADARQRLAAVPDGLVGQIASVRDAMTERIDEYVPLLDTYMEVSERLPAILGWDGPRRYLVLTQDPAELRPAGGYIGSFGIIGFDKGRITERRFRDIVTLDYTNDYPFVKPPQELADYLLGPTQSWQLADAGWSPDFPTSARNALQLYTNESGDADIDGVIGMTTYTIDELLKVTGPVTVPEYDVTIASGETTLKVLQLTRAASTPGVDRKAFLSAFANQLIASLLAMPPEKWGDLLGATDSFANGRLLLTWFPDAADQRLAARGGFDGAVRQDPGDYVFPVDANVSPVSKLNLVTTRSLDLAVQIDVVGNARDTLTATWDNRVEEPEWAVYRAMVNTGGSILGMYFRALVPERSRIEVVSGGGLTPVNAPAVVEEEAARTAIGTYLSIPPGQTSLRYSWVSPYAADVDSDGGTYRLTIQAQPGMLPGPLTLTIRVPDGYRITAASPGLTVSGNTARITATFDRDIVVGVQYGP